MRNCISFRQVFSLFFCCYHCKHIFDKNNWALLTDLLKVKNNMCIHTKTSLNFRKTHKKTPVPESFFNNITGLS